MKEITAEIIHLTDKRRRSIYEEFFVMVETVSYEVVKLFFRHQNWVVSYQGDESLQYGNYEDAIISLGILARELVKVVRNPLRILIFNKDSEVLNESFLFPSLYEENQAKNMKKSLAPKYL